MENKRYTPENMADRLMAKVQSYVDKGLPSCYNNFQDQMYDFWPDMPWDHDGYVASCKHILTHHQATLTAVEDKFHVPLRDWITKAAEKGCK